VVRGILGRGPRRGKYKSRANVSIDSRRRVVRGGATRRRVVSAEVALENGEAASVSLVTQSKLFERDIIIKTTMGIT
jgi:hypothetical protein